MTEQQLLAAVGRGDAQLILAEMELCNSERPVTVVTEELLGLFEGLLSYDVFCIAVRFVEMFQCSSLNDYLTTTKDCSAKTSVGRRRLNFI